MAGHMIALYLTEKGHDVTGFARQKSKIVKTITGDALDFTFLKNIILKGNYDCVVNCIGLLNADAENNKAKAVLTNSYLPHFLAEITNNTSTQIIHLSTDCVFSGKKGGYFVDDFPDGETFYDRSKALGEVRDNKNITLRNSIVGPDIKPAGIGLLNWFLLQKNQVYGYTKAIWTGQTTLQLAKTIEYVAANKMHGLYNAVPDESISKYELLKLFNKYLRKDNIEIIPSDTIVVANKSLVKSDLNSYTIPSYEQMIKELAVFMDNHKNLYQHYYS